MPQIPQLTHAYGSETKSKLIECQNQITPKENECANKIVLVEQSDIKDYLFAPFIKLFIDNYDVSVQIKNWKFLSRHSKLKGLMNEKFTK